MGGWVGFKTKRVVVTQLMPQMAIADKVGSGAHFQPGAISVGM